MKLEIGQFVRTKSGYICKIININDFREPNMKYGVEANYLRDVMFIGNDDIVKASFNIIDLIEVGDLVEIEFYSPRYEKRITRLFEVDFKNNSHITFNNAHCQLNIIDGNWSNADKLLKPIFKSIVTREQMEQMAYKVGE